jgi:hypothetical protein
LDRSDLQTIVLQSEKMANSENQELDGASLPIAWGTVVYENATGNQGTSEATD